MLLITKLIHRLRTAETRAMEVLYERYAGLVYSVAFKFLQNSSDAEELTQEVFMILWQRDNYQPERGSLKSFLGLLTRHRAIDKLRKRNTTQKFLARWQLHLSESSFTTLSLEEAESQERQRQIKKALDLLPLEQREILMMNFFEGLSRTQIAQKLNLPVGTVKSRVRLAFVRLKKILLEQNAQ